MAAILSQCVDSDESNNIRYKRNYLVLFCQVYDCLKKEQGFGKVFFLISISYLFYFSWALGAQLAPQKQVFA